MYGLASAFGPSETVVAPLQPAWESPSPALYRRNRTWAYVRSTDTLFQDGTSPLTPLCDR
jgi:hypothetical protein